jgi:hypothetical protein
LGLGGAQQVRAVAMLAVRADPIELTGRLAARSTQIGLVQACIAVGGEAKLLERLECRVGVGMAGLLMNSRRHGRRRSPRFD